MKSAAHAFIRHTSRLLSRPLPLATRKTLVTLASRRKLPGAADFAFGILDDLRRSDPDALHRFLWSNHLAYAETYEVRRKFGARNINPTRHILCRQIAVHLRARGIDPLRDIRSVFEIGCSTGHLLRHLETEVFPAADTFHGLDIDQHAIRAGAAHLATLRSRVRLFAADMLAADRIMGARMYDLVLCCGVLMYVNAASAQAVIRSMLAHASRLIGLICLAAPDSTVSAVRGSDGAFVHHVEHMIRSAGGRLVSSERVGSEVSGSSPADVILAELPAKAE